MTTTMPNGNEEPSAFLIRPENIGAAYDLLEELPQAAELLYAKFWRTLAPLIISGLTERKAEGWNVHCTDDDVNSFGEFPVRDEYAGLKIEPVKEVNDEPPLTCTFVIQHERLKKPQKRYDGGIYFGICFSRPLRESDLAEVRRLTKPLQQRLRARGWEDVPKIERDKWWVGAGGAGGSDFLFQFRDLNGTITLKRNEAVALARGDELEKQAAKSLLELFDTERPSVEEMNKALSSLPKTNKSAKHRPR